ncbi:nucleoside deaminase [Kallipyga massiliensis]|uniref:nucleoside deaminase n=1 Tax=Kallipyga massiliensis TaxID=1472764 RepID=UPI0034E95D6C
MDKKLQSKKVGSPLAFSTYQDRFRLKSQMRGFKGRKKPKSCQVFPLDFLDLFHMREAMAEARKAQARGEVPVGAVLVRRGATLYRAGNRVEEESSGLAHAELLLIQEASKKEGRYLHDFTLYVTLEPCLMCAAALVHARIGRVVFGAHDPERGGLGSAAMVPDLGRSLHTYSVKGGVLEEENRDLLQAFFRGRRSKQKNCG